MEIIIAFLDFALGGIILSFAVYSDFDNYGKAGAFILGGALIISGFLLV